MRALIAMWLLAACGNTTHGAFDPHPGTPFDAPPAPMPDAPVVATAFTVTHDLHGTVGYCSNVIAAGATTDQCSATVNARFSDNLVANALVFHNDNRAATCRIGHIPQVDDLSFVACPTPTATGEVTLPITPTPNATDGNYRADVLYTDVDGATKSYTTSFYVHRSIDGATPCPLDATTYPSDTRFFAEAEKEFTVPDGSTLHMLPSWIDRFTRKGVLPHSVAFASPSDVTHAPFYTLHFKGVTLARYHKLGKVDANLETSTINLGAINEFDVPVWSLRHHIAFNADKTLVVIRRAYDSRLAARRAAEIAAGTRVVDPRETPHEACMMRIPFGATTHRLRIDCDALVMNSTGQGFCMQVSTDPDDGSTTVTQGVFSIDLVAKLMRGSVGDAPASGNGAMWGPKILQPVSASVPDDEFELDDTVVLRP